jgi:hypothetical protein
VAEALCYILIASFNGLKPVATKCIEPTALAQVRMEIAIGKMGREKHMSF